MSDDVLSMLSVFGTLILVVLVFVGAYFVSRLVGKNYDGGRHIGKGRIDLLERRMLGKDQSLLIIKVAGKTMLLGVTPTHIEKIAEFEGDILQDSETEPPPQPNFLSTMKQVLHKTNGKSKGQRLDADIQSSDHHTDA